MFTSALQCTLVRCIRNEWPQVSGAIDFSCRFLSYKGTSIAYQMVCGKISINAPLQEFVRCAATDSMQKITNSANYHVTYLHHFSQALAHAKSIDNLRRAFSLFVTCQIKQTRQGHAVLELPAVFSMAVALRAWWMQTRLQLTCFFHLGSQEDKRRLRVYALAAILLGIGCLIKLA